MKRLLVVVLCTIGLGSAPALRPATTSYTDADVSRRAGYELQSVTGTVEHWVNPAFLDDGIERDPARPEALMYKRTSGGRELEALVFLIDQDERGSHRHSACIGSGGQGFPLPGGPCPPGTALQTTAPMVHVWVGEAAATFCRLNA